ncbi:hypothetical protein SY83_05285 [Paenibacillus swuensis]|uniref:DUF4082 domain-containing protein n=2 Tax=Paenibacillus swuensis TaxID=1178515 RepID=A0A172TFH7_9BACL|nr:hypothetical protein SY83_05285 [Paenibacillus swuensis]
MFSTRWMSRFVCFITVSLLLLCVPTAPAAANPDFGWTTSPAAVDYSSQLGYVDGNIGYYWDEQTGKYWRIENNNNNNRVFSGTTPETMALTGNQTLSYNGFPGGDAQYWLYHIFRRDSDNKFVAIVHIEYDYGAHPGHHHLVKMGLASTTDPTLRNWTYEGDLCTVDASLSNDGCMDAGLIQDGDYYYMFYHQSFDNWSGLYAARAPVNDYGPGKWQKWYNGSWSQPGIGGLQSPILGNESNTLYAAPSISWNTYLNKYIIIFNNVSTWVASGHSDLSGCKYDIAYTSDLSTMNWSVPETFYSYGSEGWRPYKGLMGIGADSNGKDTQWITGQTARLFVAGYGTSVLAKDVTFSDAPVPQPGEQTILGTQTPNVFSDDGPYELGTKFQTNVPGLITKVRVYTTASEGGNHTVRIWDADTGSVVAGPYNWNITAGTAGWKSFSLPEPVSTTAYKNYIVAVSTSSDGWYAARNNVFVSSVTQGNLITNTGSGVFTATTGSMPAQSYLNSNYYRDVVFVAAGETLSRPGIGSEYNPLFGGKWAGESFVASGSTLNQVSLWMQEANDADITVQLRSGSIQGPVIGTAILTTRSTGKVTADFNTPVSVTSGSTYYLRAQMSGGTTGRAQQSAADSASQGYYEGGTSTADLAYELQFSQ